MHIDIRIHIQMNSLMFSGLPSGFFIYQNTLSYGADCQWKAQEGNVCAASFDWSCSGICRSVERIKGVHERCSESEGAVWNITL